MLLKMRASFRQFVSLSQRYRNNDFNLFSWFINTYRENIKTPTLAFSITGTTGIEMKREGKGIRSSSQEGNFYFPPCFGSRGWRQNGPSWGKCSSHTDRNKDHPCTQTPHPLLHPVFCNIIDICTCATISLSICHAMERTATEVCIFVSL